MISGEAGACCGGYYEKSVYAIVRAVNAKVEEKGGAWTAAARASERLAVIKTFKVLSEASLWKATKLFFS